MAGPAAAAAVNHLTQPDPIRVMSLAWAGLKSMSSSGLGIPKSCHNRAHSTAPRDVVYAVDPQTDHSPTLRSNRAGPYPQEWAASGVMDSQLRPGRTELRLPPVPRRQHIRGPHGAAV